MLKKKVETNVTEKKKLKQTPKKKVNKKKIIERQLPAQNTEFQVTNFPKIGIIGWAIIIVLILYLLE